MTEVQPPSYENGACQTAQGDRLIWSSIICAEGVSEREGGDLLVTVGAEGLSVDVAEGSAFIQGDDVANQGMYHVFNDGTVNLVLDPADPTDARIDLVIAEVRDSQYSGANDDWILRVITGVPSPAPAPPALPNNAIALAQVTVAAGATTGAGLTVNDVRPQAELCDGISSGGYLGMQIYTANGTFQKGAWPGARLVKVRVVGGGGGGGASTAAASGENSSAAGGGGGGYAEAVIPLDQIAASEVVTIGSGGSPGQAAGGNGGGGGTSSFGALLTATGGTAGGGSSAGTSASAQGGRGGFGGGTFAPKIAANGSSGGSGGVAAGIATRNGDGGSSVLGGGGRVKGTGSGASGENGGSYGGGGAGGISTQNDSGHDGGSGAAGVVIVEVMA